MNGKKMENKPVLMYIHGFMSGANGSKQKELKTHFGHKCRVLAPELDADPDKSLDILNEIIREEQPEIIVGTSLGGWMALMCESQDAELVVVNPVIDPLKTMARWLDQPQKYFCSRKDGVQTYTLTQEVLDKYKKYKVLDKVFENVNRIHALCSHSDEIIGYDHIENLLPYLPMERLMIVNDFGHQCKGEGIKHLFGILDPIVKKKREEWKNRPKRKLGIKTKIIRILKQHSVKWVHFNEGERSAIKYSMVYKDNIYRIISISFWRKELSIQIKKSGEETSIYYPYESLPKEFDVLIMDALKYHFDNED